MLACLSYHVHAGTGIPRGQRHATPSFDVGSLAASAYSSPSHFIIIWLLQIEPDLCSDAAEELLSAILLTTPEHMAVDTTALGHRRPPVRQRLLINQVPKVSPDRH